MSVPPLTHLYQINSSDDPELGHTKVIVGCGGRMISPFGPQTHTLSTEQSQLRKKEYLFLTNKNNEVNPYIHLAK